MFAEFLEYSKAVQCIPLLSSMGPIVPEKQTYISSFRIVEDNYFKSSLMAATLYFLLRETCQQAYPDQVMEFMLCAGYSHSQVDSCQSVDHLWWMITWTVLPTLGTVAMKQALTVCTYRYRGSMFEFLTRYVANRRLQKGNFVNHKNNFHELCSSCNSSFTSVWIGV